MSAIEDVNQGIASVLAALEESATAAAGVAAAAEQGVNAIAIAGVESDIEAWNVLKERADALITELAGTAQTVEEVQEQANAIAGGT